jgi:hypothetical protein
MYEVYYILRCGGKNRQKLMPKYGLAIPHLWIAMYRTTVLIVQNVTNLSTFTEISVTVSSIPTTAHES